MDRQDLEVAVKDMRSGRIVDSLRLQILEKTLSELNAIDAVNHQQDAALVLQEILRTEGAKPLRCTLTTYGKDGFGEWCSETSNETDYLLRVPAPSANATRLDHLLRDEQIQVIDDGQKVVVSVDGADIQVQEARRARQRHKGLRGIS